MTHIRMRPRRWLMVAGLALLASGCSTMTSDDANLVTFSTQMAGMNEVPPVSTPATGRVDAVFNRETRLLRWKASWTGLSGSATAAHFHGPAEAGANARVALGWQGSLGTAHEGQATLTPEQAADLMAGRWYANVHSAAHPAGEIRGQMTVRR